MSNDSTQISPERFGRVAEAIERETMGDDILGVDRNDLSSEIQKLDVKSISLGDRTGSNQEYQFTATVYIQVWVGSGSCAGDFDVQGTIEISSQSNETLSCEMRVAE